MSRFYSHINTAKTILALYDGTIPFAAFIKDFFSKEKKYGSRDRRTISSVCYNYFRTGNALKEKTVEERLIISMFLCTNSPNEILQNERPALNEKVSQPLAEKIEVANIDIEKIFPFPDELSAGIDTKDFNASFLIQPKLFIRLRPAKKEIVKQKLASAAINFEQINETCLAFANGTKLEEIIKIDEDAVIQDVNSQRTGELIAAAKLPEPVNIWDCCAGSGGKSIMVYDMFRRVQLTVSDVRPTIIQNLKKRFEKAHIKDYRAFIADLTNYQNLKNVAGNSKFDLIICDAPCSGSGTWSRTPEQLIFFKEESIEKYASLQKSICINTIPFVKKGACFLYITCSVFTKENEQIVDFIQESTKLVLVKMELLKGYNIKADTMFAALFYQPD